ncbi:MAG: hypothetical protein Q8941_10310 [Bacteroidota bacterium]|nr:hypothetical protein [Bacteroidota bacterium]
MQSFSQKTKAARVIILGAFFTTFFSFYVKPGGEGFEIYLNNKMVLQQFGSQQNPVQSIQLDQSFSNSQLSVKYFHCGRAGTNRSITIRDGQNKVLKEWKFADVSNAAVSVSNPAMTCKVSDILSLQKTNPGKLNLYYSSSELPKGRLLATLIIGEVTRAK